MGLGLGLGLGLGCRPGFGLGLGFGFGLGLGLGIGIGLGLGCRRGLALCRWGVSAHCCGGEKTGITRSFRGSWHACLPIMAREPPGKRHRSPLGARTSERQSDSQLSAW